MCQPKATIQVSSGIGSPLLKSRLTGTSSTSTGSTGSRSSGRTRSWSSVTSSPSPCCPAYRTSLKRARLPSIASVWT